MRRSTEPLVEVIVDVARPGSGLHAAVCNTDAIVTSPEPDLAMTGQSDLVRPGLSPDPDSSRAAGPREPSRPSTSPEPVEQSQVGRPAHADVARPAGDPGPADLGAGPTPRPSRP